MCCLKKFNTGYCAAAAVIAVKEKREIKVVEADRILAATMLLLLLLIIRDVCAFIAACRSG